MTFFGPDLRNGLPIGLGSVAGFGIAPRFSPSSLFAGGVQGAWYDPSDLTTLFQDSAGTTPVTAVEQPVGLMLDKSKGLVLGTPVTISGWTNYALGPYETFTTSGSTISSAVNSSSAGYAYTNKLNMVSGQWYRMDVNVGLVSGSAPLISTGNNGTSNNLGSLSNKQLVNGSNTIYFSFNGDANDYIWIYSGAAASFSMTISITPVAGNHAFQNTSASRPTLRARYNLLTRSEEFNDAAWTKNNATVTVNATTAPDGTTTADKIVENSVSGAHGVYTLNSTTGQLCLSIYAKAAERSWLVLGFYTVSDINTWFNLSNGTIGSSAAGNINSITAVGNGWYRCSVTRTLSGLIAVTAGASTADNTQVYTGDGTSGIFIWGAQLVPTAVFPSNTYQRVGAATDYATGAAFPPYLFFDGTDDSMLTNSVDFTGTDKMLVVAGVTKNSDATFGTVAELSVEATPNPGTFIMRAPQGAPAANYAFFHRGSVTLADATTPSSYAAPITNVLSGLSNLGGPSVSIRVNGAQAASSAGLVGAGNYGNYPLYIGSRAGSSLRFNGNIYSLVIAGALYSAGQVSSTEQWVAAKTPLGSI